MYPLGIVGNCNVSAFVSLQGSVDWLCMPRPDSPPIFGGLIDSDGGKFEITPVGKYESTQFYMENTNILVTEFRLQDGGRFRIVDFCPRFHQFGRIFRPQALYRIVEPVEGTSRIRVNFNPINGWSKQTPHRSQGNSHLRYKMSEGVLRLSTNAPITYVNEQAPFHLDKPLVFTLTWDDSIRDDLLSNAYTQLTKTRLYWEQWVRHCNIPFLFQKEVIRSALALKLNCFEDTGAILAALSTSLPEIVGSERNWDYRFCWLRDAYFFLSAFRNIGHFEEMLGFMNFLLDLVYTADSERLGPVYSLDLKKPLPEYIHDNWTGYQGSSPVRSNNQAGEHVQNDIYGELLLTLAPIYYDERFIDLRTSEHSHVISRLIGLAIDSVGQVDAGLWELRNQSLEHTFTNLMSWAGLNRFRVCAEQSRIQLELNKITQAEELALDRLAKSQHEGVLTNSPNDSTFDASLLLATVLRYPNDQTNRKTVDKVIERLGNPQTKGFEYLLYRYRRADDFGTPKHPFVACSFWLAEALSALGEHKRANIAFEQALSTANHVGLFSEHFDIHTKTQTGNFAQAYSHAALINAAFRLSPPWSHIL